MPLLDIGQNRRREGYLPQVEGRSRSTTLTDMAQIGQQSIRDIDRGMRPTSLMDCWPIWAISDGLQSIRDIDRGMRPTDE